MFTASYKASSPMNRIQCFLLQFQKPDTCRSVRNSPLHTKYLEKEGKESDY
jgi:hypothetical protein